MSTLATKLQDELDNADNSIREYIWNAYIRVPQAKILAKRMTRKQHKLLMRKVVEDAKLKTSAWCYPASSSDNQPLSS